MRRSPRALPPLLLALLAAGTLPASAAQAGPAAGETDPGHTDSRPAPAEPAASPTPPPRAERAARAPGTIVPPVRPRTVSVAGKGVIELSPPAPPSGRWKGFPVSLSLRDAPLPEVLRSFARLAGFNLVLDPRVQGEVTVELEDVPWDQALHVILKTHGMGAEVDGRVWMVAPR
jgi:type IV pilus assembly protein PilQ